MGSGVADGLGVGDGVALTLGEGSGVPDGVGVADGAGVALTEGDGSGVPDGDGLGVVLTDGEGSGVPDGVGVGVAEGAGAGVMAFLLSKSCSCCSLTQVAPTQSSSVFTRPVTISAILKIPFSNTISSVLANRETIALNTSSISIPEEITSMLADDVPPFKLDTVGAQ